MKKINIIVASLGALALVGCNNDFMDRFPTTSIAPETFFQTEKDLELYTNTYYEYVTPYYFDYVSDNYTTYSDTHTNNDLIRGNINAETVGGWDDWGTLRRFNFFLANLDHVSGDPAAIAHYVGLTRLERAIWYYEKVKQYNDVPWYSTPLTDTDEELLYKGRDSRTMVVDSIMADLDYAVANMSENIGNRTVFSKWYALAMQARICLHEGTYRKYHDELGLQGTANAYLEKAVQAASTLMESGKFAIDKAGGKETAYRKLFSSYNLYDSPEIILFKDYDLEEQIKHNAGAYVLSVVCNLSRSLMESYEYLTPEGKAVPFTSLPNYEKKTFIEVFENRDPRMSQTFMAPGYTRAGDITPFRPVLTLGGYPCVKFESDDVASKTGVSTFTDLPVSRYAEVLLIYAEAKAELGQLTQNDLDKTVNEIRSRVEMPRIVIGEILDDPNLNAQYPGISDKALLQIRRERRIELMGENFRWDDLMRWKEAHLIRGVQEGIYIEHFGVFDTSGDGVPEVGIYQNKESNPIPEEERGNYSFYYVDEGFITLSNGDSGYILIKNEIGNRKFEEPKFYYRPIPLQQRVLNPNLEETIFW